MHYSSSLAFLLPLAVSAAPAVDPVEARGLLGGLSSLVCLTNKFIINSLQQDPLASQYCANILSLPTQTLTNIVTVTPAALTRTIPVTITGATGVLTLTSTVTTNVATTVTSTVTSPAVTVTNNVATGSSVLSCLNSAYTAPAAAVNKRDISRPTYIPSYLGNDVISALCGCWGPAAPTVTATSTATAAAATVTVTSSVVQTATSTTTLKVTSTLLNSVVKVATVIPTTTIQLSGIATSISTSGNGLTYKKYTHNFDADSATSGFSANAIKAMTPDFTGALSSLTWSTPHWPNTAFSQLNLPGFPSTQDVSKTAMVVQGFFVAQQSGTHTFSTTADNIDNWGYLWVGDAALKYADDNTAFKAGRTGAGNNGGSTTLKLNKGDAVPLTWLWANGGSAGQSWFAVTQPDNSVVTDTTGFFAPACNSNVFA